MLATEVTMWKELGTVGYCAVRPQGCLTVIETAAGIATNSSAPSAGPIGNIPSKKPVGANAGLVDDEIEALRRIRENPNGPVLNDKAPNTNVDKPAANKTPAGSGTPSSNPIEDDFIPRNGDRSVTGQGQGTVTCGNHSCGMMLDTMGKPVEVENLIAQFPPSSTGLDRNRVAQILRSNGVDATALESRNLDDIARYTANGNPVIVRVADDALNYSHFVVVDGVTNIPGVGKVVAIRDPAGNNGQGRQYFVRSDRFNNLFSGEVILQKGKYR